MAASVAIVIAVPVAWVGGSVLAVVLAQPFEDARPGVAEACLYAFAAAIGVATIRFVFRALRPGAKE
ncbi:MAG TPA: hypothetical protein VGB55_08615 [Tepidisphaeraceae bacterium]